VGALWPLILRSLTARPLRAALTVVAVALGVAALTGVQLALPALDDQASRAQLQRAGASQLDVRSASVLGFDDFAVARLQHLDGVRLAVPLEEKRVAARADPRSITGLTVTVVGVHDGAAGLRPVQLLEGRLPRAGSTDEVTLDAGLAAALPATGAPRPLISGDEVRLLTGTGSDVFHVVGISSGTSAGPAFTRSAAFVSAAAAQGPFAAGLHVPLIALALTPGAAPATVAREVHDALGAGAITVDPRAVATAPLQQLRPLLALVTLLSVLIGAGVVANTLWLGVLERRREIGLLRAAGAGRRDVFRLFLGEAAVLAVAGAAAGVVAGIVLAGVLVRQLAPADLGVPAVSLNGWGVLVAVALGIAMALLGASVPAILAARMKPLDALRAGGAGSPERTPRAVAVIGLVLVVAAALAMLTGLAGPVGAGTVALLVGAVFCLPFIVPPFLRRLSASPRFATGSTGLAAANLVRHRNRTSLTVAGLSVGVAVAVAVSALTAGALAAGQRWVDRLFVGDVLVRSPATQPDAVATAFTTAAGVRSAVPLRFVSADVGGETVGIAVIDPAAYARGGTLDVDGSRAAVFTALASPDRPAMVVPRQLVDLLGWRPGVSLQVATQRGLTAFDVAAVAEHTFPGGDGREAVLVGRATAARTLGDVATGFDSLDVSSGGASLRGVEDAAASFGMQATSVSTVDAATRAAVDHSVALLSVFAWLAVVVAMLAVVNTLVVNVRQGARERGLLRAVGLSRRRVRTLVLAEAALLAVSGAVAGVAVGCVLALPLLHASAGPGFDPGFVFPLWSVLGAVAAVLLGALLAVLVPARIAAGQSIVGAIRHA
jgi:putative ABC transport system permease protein